MDTVDPSTETAINLEKVSLSTPAERPKKSRWDWIRAWRVIAMVCIVAVIVFLLQGRTNEAARMNATVDKVRTPVCAILYAALSRMPLDPVTPQVLSARQDYYRAYGPEGLDCKNGPLPILPNPSIFDHVAGSQGG